MKRYPLELLMLLSCEKDIEININEEIFNFSKYSKIIPTIRDASFIQVIRINND